MSRSATGELTLAPRWARGARRAVTTARTARWLARRPQDSGAGFRVLLYHRVCSERDPLAVSIERFEQQLECLADDGYAVVPVAAALRALAAGAARSRLIALSFDDGYRDVAEHAVPLLRRHGFRGSLFVATGLVDGRARPSWYGRNPPAVLTWNELRSLDATGELEIEAHSVTHRDLVRLADAEARAEIAASRDELERRLGHPVGGFSYPAGRYGERERRLVAEAGFTYAVTCDPGPNRAETNRYALRRIEVLGSDGLHDFRARLGGGHDAPMPLRDTYRRLRG